MTEQFASLCALIIEDLYGDFLALLFHKLAERGRLTSTQLAQRCHLPLRQVKSGLAALIQIQVVYHHTTLEHISTYQANTQSAYNLVRMDRLVELAHEKHGSRAAILIQELTLLGFVSSSELEFHVQKRIDLDESTVSNLTPNTLQKLIDDKFVRRVRRARFQERFDSRQDAEKIVHKQGVLLTTKGKKAQADLDEKVDAELEKRLDAAVPADFTLHSRTVEHKESSLTSQGSNHDHVVLNDSNNKMNEELFLCINLSKVAQSLRNQTLSSQVEHVFGNTAGKIMATVLDQVDIGSETTRGNLPNTSAMSRVHLDIYSLLASLNATDTGKGANGHSHVNGWHEDEPKSNGVHPNPNEVGEADIQHHLGQVREAHSDYLSWDTTSGTWVVDRSKLNLHLRDQEMLKLIGDRVGRTGLRLIRMLIDKGKLDEKSLQEIALLGAKELRQNLAKLKMLGFLELQEIPREPQRQPNRTIFLWFFDADRVLKVLLAELYKTMARVYQRMKLERERLSSTLEKIERTDVHGSEQEILGPGELLILQQWRKKETWLIAEIGRLDTSIALLQGI